MHKLCKIGLLSFSTLLAAGASAQAANTVPTLSPYDIQLLIANSIGTASGNYIGSGNGSAHVYYNSTGNQPSGASVGDEYLDGKNNKVWLFEAGSPNVWTAASGGTGASGVTVNGTTATSLTIGSGLAYNATSGLITATGGNSFANSVFTGNVTLSTSTVSGNPSFALSLSSPSTNPVGGYSEGSQAFLQFGGSVAGETNYNTGSVGFYVFNLKDQAFNDGNGIQLFNTMHITHNIGVGGSPPDIAGTWTTATATSAGGGGKSVMEVDMRDNNGPTAEDDSRLATAGGPGYSGATWTGANWSDRIYWNHGGTVTLPLNNVFSMGQYSSLACQMSDLANEVQNYAIATAGGSNVGNGTINIISTTNSTLIGTYTITISSPTSKFTITDPSSNVTNGTVSTNTSGTNYYPITVDGINFSVQAGGTAFTTGDTFSLVVTSAMTFSTINQVAHGINNGDAISITGTSYNGLTNFTSITPTTLSGYAKVINSYEFAFYTNSSLTTPYTDTGSFGSGGATPDPWISARTTTIPKYSHCANYSNAITDTEMDMETDSGVIVTNRHSLMLILKPLSAMRATTSDDAFIIAAAGPHPIDSWHNLISIGSESSASATANDSNILAIQDGTRAVIPVGSIIYAPTVNFSNPSEQYFADNVWRARFTGITSTSSHRITSDGASPFVTVSSFGMTNTNAFFIPYNGRYHFNCTLNAIRVDNSGNIYKDGVTLQGQFDIERKSGSTGASGTSQIENASTSLTGTGGAGGNNTAFTNGGTGSNNAYYIYTFPVIQQVYNTSSSFTSFTARTDETTIDDTVDFEFNVSAGTWDGSMQCYESFIS